MKLPELKLQGYVIVNPLTEEFSSGGCYVQFRNKGKIWRSLGHVKSHITMLVELTRSYNKKAFMLSSSTLALYKGCKVYEIGEKVEVLDVWEYAKASAEKQIAESSYMQRENWKVIE